MRRAGEVKIGDTFTKTQTVDRYRSLFYAGASGDFNPIHTDVEFAQAVGYSTTILQGMCTYAFLTDAVTEYLGDPGALTHIKARFSKPVLPDDTLTFTVSVREIEGKTVKLDLAVVNQNGDPIITSATATGRLAG